MATLTLSQAVDFFKLTNDDLQTQKRLIQNYQADENKNSTVGNKIIQHFQIHEIFKCRYKKKPTFIEMLLNETLYEKMVHGADNKPGHPMFVSSLYNTFKFWGCPVSIFKATQSKHIYELFKATHILDPTAGWGG